MMLVKWPVFGLIAVAALLIVSFVLWDNSGASVTDLRGQTHVSVVLSDVGFEPSYVRVSRGARVTFTTTRPDPFWPASNPHPTHVIYPAFDPKAPIASSSTWSFVFDKIGTWGYHDHLRSYYTGTIDVVE